MKRRISSRDDLFLSALDMFTLLSLVLIGFAFVVAREGEKEEFLDLPTLEGPSDRTEDETDVVTVQWQKSDGATMQWQGTGECRAGRGLEQECKISASMPKRSGESASQSAEGDETFSVPCCPSAFYTGAVRPEQTGLPELRERMKVEFPEVAIVCSRGKTDACFNLQWVMASGKFRVLAVTVTDEQAGG